MFVVKRPFRDVHGMVPAGSIVEPAGISRFRRRLLEGHIVEVTEQNFDKYKDFFEKRFGVTLTLSSEETNDEETVAISQPVKEINGEAANTVQQTKVAQTKSVAKATAKATSK